MAKEIAKNKKIVKKIISTKKSSSQKSKKSLKSKPTKKIVSKKKPTKIAKIVAKPTKKPVAKKVIPTKKQKLVPVAKPIAKVSSKKIVKTEKRVAVKEIKVIAPTKPIKPEKLLKKEIPRSKKSMKPKKMRSVFFIKNEILNLKPSSSKLAKKEPKGKYSLEYIVNCSPTILYEFLTTPSGLCEWFADDVNIKDNHYSFIWDGGAQIAEILEATPSKTLRLKWTDRNDGSYFQFSIETDELTNDISLIITDFAENEAEQKSSKMLWDTQIGKLLHIIGA
ncbi:MAG: START-like domain-containing protein [Bacteroidia bacterium]